MVVVGARAAAALGAAAVVVGGLPIALPAQLRALGGSVARVDRRLQAVESMDILGTIQQESVAPNPENVRATCYMGLIEEVTTKCNLLDDDGEEVPPGVWYYEKTEGWNMSPRGESDVLCLQCCSQLYEEPNERIHEEWNFDCDVDTTVRTKFDTGYYGYEFRFARNRDEKDDKMVRCAMGRIGCEYEGIFGEYEMDGRPLSCTSKQADGDYGSCSADNSSCVCEIPGSQRGGTGPHPDTNARNDYLDGVRSRVDEQSCRYRSAREREDGRSWYLQGYELTVYVEELTENDGSYWRSVTGCHVKTYETETLRAGDKFFQRIVMKGNKDPRPYNWLAGAHGLPFVVCAVLLACFVGALLVRCARDTPCPTCGSKLIFMPTQCFYCSLYGAPMPDPVLLARIRARGKFVSGQGFVAHTFRKRPGSEQTRAGCARLYAGRACKATGTIAGRHVLALLKCLGKGTLHCGDALLHFFYRCVLRRRRGPGPVCLRTFVADESEYVERDPPVPTKIYVADPALRSQNAFEALTRPMPLKERELVAAEQDYVRKFREEKRAKRLESKRRRETYYAAASAALPAKVAPANALEAGVAAGAERALADAGSVASKGSKSSTKRGGSPRPQLEDGDAASVASSLSARSEKTPVLPIEQEPTG
jgi:hypothetical protein